MRQNLPLTILLTLSFIIGILTLNDYGESWDELKLYNYAADSREAYVMWPQHGTIPVTGDRFENYGPAFVMFTSLVAKAFAQFLPAIKSVDVQHLVYFLTFLIGVWAFYHLSNRWMSRNAAFGATLLYLTQPVFWGHAFINPKDIPLLSLFLLAVYLGLRMHDTLFGHGTDSASAAVSAAWSRLPYARRRLLVGAASFWLACMVLLFGGTALIHQWFDNAIRTAANGEPSLIPLIAPRVLRIAPEIYIEKFFVLFLRVRTIYFLLITGILIWLYRRILPAALRALGNILLPGLSLGWQFPFVSLVSGPGLSSPVIFYGNQVQKRGWSLLRMHWWQSARCISPGPICGPTPSVTSLKQSKSWRGTPGPDQFCLTAPRIQPTTCQPRICPFFWLSN